jgi:uncharacterized protein YbaR (Trm112 family)
MLDTELLEILVCPESQQTLRLADTSEIDRLNRAVASGSLRNRGGKPVAATLTAGLIREDGRLFYPIRDDIPIMLLDEAIDLGDAGESKGDA